ncbi:MAG: ATP-binding protein [Vicinamibacterales bacterium]
MAALSSLANRIFLVSAALALVCTGMAIAVVNVLVTAEAERELRRGLEQAGAIVDQQRTARSELLIALARLIADLPRLKAAVDTNDPPTVQPVAADYERQVDVDLLVVTNSEGAILAGVSRPPAAVPPLPTIAAALGGRDSGSFCLHPGGLLQVVSVAITAGAAPPEIIGTLTVGFLLGDGLAADLKNLTGSDVAFAGGGRILAATIPSSDRAALLPMLGRTGVSRGEVAGVEHLALWRPLSPHVAGTLADGARVHAAPSTEVSDPVVLVLRSRPERLRFLRPIQAALGLTGAVAVLLATLMSYAISRTITRPLGAITATMKEIAATGDLTRRISWKPGRWDDEDAQLLAGTFNTLAESVAASQRETSERERLSALGRLSTVVAHEVRNPLMIIRAALRPLARESVTSAEVREAVSDIEEEVRRLDRVVNDVLDFARPVRFALAPADVNGVARDAAAAAAAGSARRALPRLVLDPGVRPIVTDAERLRMVLVNLLVNAWQAVDARESRQLAANTLRRGAEAVAAGGGDLRADVELRTEVLPGGGVAITVSDCGVGIPAGDAGRVFEAFYTTKPSGTGLGLALARNVIEGLGGSIGIRSEPGAGTEFRIELPERRESSGAAARWG